MKSSFDQQLKKQLEESSPEDLGYKPDRDKLWSRIEAKQTRKRMPLRLWVSHAAAIAAGLIIGYFLLTTYNQDAGQAGIKQVEQSTATLLPQQETQAQKQLPTAHQTAVQPATAAIPKVHAGNNKTALPRQKQESLPEKTSLPSPVIPVPEDRTEAPPVMAHVVQPKVKVLHLMDIKNENARLMRVKEPQPETGWARLIPDSDIKSNTETFSAQISKHILHTKNK